MLNPALNSFIGQIEEYSFHDRLSIIQAVFTIDPIISCEFVTTILSVAKIPFNICPKKVGTRSEVKNIAIV